MFTICLRWLFVYRLGQSPVGADLCVRPDKIWRIIQKGQAQGPAPTGEIIFVGI